MQNVKIVKVSQDVDIVACPDHNNDMLHPKIYLKFDNKKEVQCYYCSTIYAKEVDE